LAAGLTSMRGATPPRLILELICGRILLPASDDAALLARVEKLERLLSVSTPTTPIAATTNTAEPKTVEPAVVKSEQKGEVKSAPKAAAKIESVKEEVKTTQVKASGTIEISALRRMWPEVIENVKKRRRLTWSLLSTSAQIISLDDEVITIGMVNVGAKDSFIRSESDVILSDAFEEVTGVRRKIAATVDTSISANTMARGDEDLADADMLSGAELLASKLGAKVIKESN
jgi:DNA polymerase-3 subunit gamma/tau